MVLKWVRVLGIVFLVAFVLVVLQVSADEEYWGSKKSDKYHYPTCRYAKKIKEENQGRIPGRVIVNNRWQNWYYDIIKRKVFEYTLEDVENDGGNFRIKNEDDKYVYVGKHISAFDKARAKQSSNCVVM